VCEIGFESRKARIRQDDPAGNQNENEKESKSKQEPKPVNKSRKIMVGDGRVQ
jgi:hypothetical protein